ncbi:MAG TPA: ABC transporter permease [Gemmatimonadales bacterium]|nr:ABC transporter permease [Gemmatimonadales bacterium]
MSALAGLVRKETRHLLRDRQTLAILLLLPLVSVLLFGFAVRTDVRAIPVAIVDPSPDAASRALAAQVAQSPQFRLRGVVRSEQALERDFRAGTLRQAIVLPEGTARRLARGDRIVIGVITDAADPNTGRVMGGHVAAMLARWEADQVGPSGVPRVTMLTRMRFNPTLESVNLFVPGLIALVLTIVAAMMTAISITREKERGTMELLLASPLRPATVVLGKVTPYVVLGMANALTVLLAARLVFGMPLRGHPGLLLVAALLYVIASLGLGILISTRAETERTAIMAALAGLLLPTLMLSGFIFPLEALPAPLRAVAQVIPARWFLVIVRGVMVKGATLADLHREVAVLATMAIALLGIGIRRLAIRLP